MDIVFLIVLHNNVLEFELLLFIQAKVIAQGNIQFCI
jgi:hypothetical protein